LFAKLIETSEKSKLIMLFEHEKVSDWTKISTLTPDLSQQRRFVSTT